MDDFDWIAHSHFYDGRMMMNMRARFDIDDSITITMNKFNIYMQIKMKLTKMRARKNFGLGFSHFVQQ